MTGNRSAYEEVEVETGTESYDLADGKVDFLISRRGITMQQDVAEVCFIHLCLRRNR